MRKPRYPLEIILLTALLALAGGFWLGRHLPPLDRWPALGPVVSPGLPAPAAAPAELRAAPGEAEIAVFFSPGPETRRAIVEALDAAQTSALVAVYYLTDPPLAAALIRAHRRGVQVRVYLDRSQASHQHSQARELARAGVTVRIAAGAGLMHHKFAVMDDTVVLTGSYNWTRAAAERNRENLLLLTRPGLAAAYRAQFAELWERWDPALTAELTRR